MPPSGSLSEQRRQLPSQCVRLSPCPKTGRPGFKMTLAGLKEPFKNSYCFISDGMWKKVHWHDGELADTERAAAQWEEKKRNLQKKV